LTSINEKLKNIKLIQHFISISVCLLAQQAVQST